MLNNNEPFQGLQLMLQKIKDISSFIVYADVSGLALQTNANSTLKILNQFSSCGARIIVSFSSGAACFVGKGGSRTTFNSLYTSLENQIEIKEGFTDQQASTFLSKKKSPFSVDDGKCISYNNPFLLNMVSISYSSNSHKLVIQVTDYESKVAGM